MVDARGAVVTTRAWRIWPAAISWQKWFWTRHGLACLAATKSLASRTRKGYKVWKHQRCQQGLARAITCKDGPSSAGSEAWGQQYRSKLWSIEMFLPGDHRSSMFPKVSASWFSPFMLHMLTASNSQQVRPTERGQKRPVRISLRNLLHPLGTPNLGHWHRH